MSLSKMLWNSPIGLIRLEWEANAIVGLRFSSGTPHQTPSLTALSGPLQEIREYFEGRRKRFTCSKILKGSDFQKDVWNCLSEIPYGETRSYQQTAQAIGRMRAHRAVAHACNQNPLAIIVPCHRVIHQDGDITGFASGTWRKRWLLKHEKRGAHTGIDICMA